MDAWTYATIGSINYSHNMPNTNFRLRIIRRKHLTTHDTHEQERQEHGTRDLFKVLASAPDHGLRHTSPEYNHTQSVKSAHRCFHVFHSQTSCRLSSISKTRGHNRLM